MRRICYPFGFILFVAIISFTSCNRIDNKDNEVVDGNGVENLGAFQFYEGFFDTSVENQFPESFLCNDWVFNGGTEDTYIDGTLVKSEELSWEKYISKRVLSIHQDHTVGNDGIWMYVYNNILFKFGGGYSRAEVTDASAERMCLREEYFVAGDATTFFFRDPSGKHHFNVYEYKPVEALE